MHAVRKVDEKKSKGEFFFSGLFVSGLSFERKKPKNPKNFPDKKIHPKLIFLSILKQGT